LRDWHHALVDLWREWTVDPDFFVASCLSLLKCRIVEKREAYGTFNLQGPAALQKNGGAMRIDPPDIGVRSGVGEKSKHALLHVGLGRNRNGHSGADS
jgi:hypothetical protein